MPVWAYILSLAIAFAYVIPAGGSLVADSTIKQTLTYDSSHPGTFHALYPADTELIHLKAVSNTQIGLK